MQPRDNRIKANTGEMRTGVDTNCNIQIGLFPVFGTWYTTSLKFWILIYLHFKLTDKNHYSSGLFKWARK